MQYIERIRNSRYRHCGSLTYLSGYLKESNFGEFRISKMQSGITVVPSSCAFLIHGDVKIPYPSGQKFTRKIISCPFYTEDYSYLFL
ncbi:hypothetical protein LENED_007614 [Lentinula edodes]|uniref:Uncharacterized protein n=1 Tax=Lentinula edodes TaxID=5353 RepID=A0A1Q3EEY2_LENED|nr:hypothetical protein LENED_007614 [Lentinula edodes]